MADEQLTKQVQEILRNISNERTTLCINSEVALNCFTPPQADGDSSPNACKVWVRQLREQRFFPTFRFKVRGVALTRVWPLHEYIRYLYAT